MDMLRYGMLAWSSSREILEDAGDEQSDDLALSTSGQGHVSLVESIVEQRSLEPPGMNLWKPDG